MAKKNRVQVEYEIVPLQGVGGVKLGSTRQAVRSFLGEKPDIDGRTEYYHGNGLQVDYNKKGKVEFILVGNGFGIKATYRGRSVFETTAEELIHIVKEHAALDEEDEELGYTYTFPEIELCFWRPLMPESPSDPEGRFFETVAIGERGYFSDADEED